MKASEAILEIESLLDRIGKDVELRLVVVQPSGCLLELPLTKVVPVIPGPHSGNSETVDIRRTDRLVMQAVSDVEIGAIL